MLAVRRVLNVGAGSVGRFPLVVSVGSRKSVSVPSFAPCAVEMKAFPGNQVSIAKDPSGPVSLCDAQLTSGSSGQRRFLKLRGDGTVDVSSHFPRRSPMNGKFRVKRELMDVVQYSSVVYRSGGNSSVVNRNSRISGY